jgi:hypothetical protein
MAKHVRRWLPVVQPRLLLDRALPDPVLTVSPAGRGSPVDGGFQTPPTFRAFGQEPGETSGIHNLARSLSVDGSSATPLCRYKLIDAADSGLDAWTDGVDLARLGSGGAYEDGAPGLGLLDDSFGPEASQFYREATATMGGLGTDDLAFEAVFQAPWTTAGQYDLMGTVVGGSWYGFGLFQVSGSSSFRLLLVDDSGTSKGITATVTPGAWYHLLAFVDRDENSTDGARIYLDGVDAGATQNFSTVGSIGLINKFALGANNGWGGKWPTRICYCAIWTKSSWFPGGADNPTAWAATAKERFVRYSGLYPRIALGTALPTTRSRSSDAWLDKLESDGSRRLYLVGDDWLRVVSRPGSSGRTLKGYLCERQEENLLLQSVDLSTTWATTNAAINTDAATGPTGETDMDSIQGDATDGVHAVSQAVTLTATVHTLSGFFKKGAVDFVYLQDSTGGASYRAFFDLDAGRMGTIGGSVIDSWIEDWGGGIYRCGMSFTGTAASHTLLIGAANADNDTTYAGSGTDDLYVALPQCSATPLMLSPIRTTTTTATRERDELVYDGDDGNLGGVGGNREGTLYLQSLIADYTMPSGDSDRMLLSLSDGSDGNNTIEPYVDQSAAGDLGFKVVEAGSGGADLAVDVPVADGDDHEIRCDWARDSFHVEVYITQETTPDTSGTPPDDLDRIVVGARYDGTKTCDGVVGDLQLYGLQTEDVAFPSRDGGQG